MFPERFLRSFLMSDALGGFGGFGRFFVGLAAFAQVNIKTTPKRPKHGMSEVVARCGTMMERGAAVTVVQAVFLLTVYWTTLYSGWRLEDAPALCRVFEPQ